MPITEHEALAAACRFIKQEGRRLAYPVSEAPIRQSHIPDSDPPSIALPGGPIGRDFWEFYFEYRPPASLLVDPTCAKVFVDSTTGAAALFSPRRHPRSGS